MRSLSGLASRTALAVMVFTAGSPALSQTLGDQVAREHAMRAEAYLHHTPEQKAAEVSIRAVIARWYQELRKADDGRPHALAAPGMIEASRYYSYIDNGSAALGPKVYTSLPARSMKFDYDIDSLRIDTNFAKVRVWERGYTYAWAAQKTYESAHATTFVLERQEADGNWLILAHETSSQGIPPNRITDPMPDLRDEFYSTIGKNRDPEADAASARTF